MTGNIGQVDGCGGPETAGPGTDGTPSAGLTHVVEQAAQDMSAEQGQVPSLLRCAPEPSSPVVLGLSFQGAASGEFLDLRVEGDVDLLLAATKNVVCAGEFQDP
jgi:hypothetical protein